MTALRAVLAGGVVLAAVAHLGAAGGPKSQDLKDLKDLKKQADAVLDRGAVDGRADIDVVFEYARLSAQAGVESEALKYYEAGLRVHPLNMARQLAYAELLAKRGQMELARRRAGIVANSAEEDELVIAARKLLGDEAKVDLPPIAKPEGNEPALVLVPMGDVDILLLEEVRQRLAKSLGIEVMLRKVDIQLPPPRRTPYKDLAAQFRKGLLDMKAKAPGPFADLLKEQDLTEKDLANDDAAVRMFQTLVAQSGNVQAVRGIASALDEARREGDQWDAEELIKLLRQAVRPGERPRARFLGVLRKDISSEKYAFLLASRTGEHGVLSYCRYRSACTNETPDRARLRRRLHVQCINSAGHLFGLERCSDPTCPRSYAHSVAEHDRKTEQLCPDCRKAFDAAFGRK